MYLNQTSNGKFGQQVIGLMKDVWEEFDYLDLKPFGRDSFFMAVIFRSVGGPNGEFVLEFQELSEGERMLIVLYCLLAYQRAMPATTIIVDEPDNFVALSELQPWIIRLLDERPDGGQIILVSHNAEIIGTMGEKRVALFDRSDHLAATTVRSLAPSDSPLSLTERLARGWLGDAPSEGESISEQEARA